MDEGKRILEMKKDARIETRAIHAAAEFDGGVGAVTTPIFSTSTYRLKSPGDESGYVYSRSANPTRDALEKTLASLENGTAGFAFSSGLAATNTVMNLLKAGDEVVVGDDLYGGTYRQFEKVLKNFNLKFNYVDARDPRNIDRASSDKTALIWLETPTNPLMHLYDIGAAADIAKKYGAILVVDNTFATPYIQQPLDLGADIVLHSLTKYLAGHADLVGGAVVTGNEELAERIGFYQNAIGAILGPFDAFLCLRGIKTLALRMERHSANASKIAKFLSEKRNVKEIMYPGFDGSKLPNNMRLSGGMVSFVIDADFETVKKFVMSTGIFVLAESLGGVESLINHPASMTHASIPKEVREERGIVDGLVRLSVGIENIDDLIEDLESAFAAIDKAAARA